LSGGKRGDYQSCSVLYCVLKPCTVISTFRRAVLTVLWIGFVPQGPFLSISEFCLYVTVIITPHRKLRTFLPNFAVIKLPKFAKICKKNFWWYIPAFRYVSYCRFFVGCTV